MQRDFFYRAAAASFTILHIADDECSLTNYEVANTEFFQLSNELRLSYTDNM